MPSVVVSDNYRITFWCQYEGQAGLNVRHIDIGSVSTPAISSQELIDAISDDTGESIRDCISEEASYLGAILKQVVTPSEPPEFSLESAGIGSRTGSPLPSQVSGICTMRTTFPGRAGRGRLYIPFPADSDNDVTGAPRPSATYLINALAYANAVLGTKTYTSLTDPTKFCTAVWTLPPHGGVEGFPITSAVARAKWATQRRRGLLSAGNVPPF